MTLEPVLCKMVACVIQTVETIQQRSLRGQAALGTLKWLAGTTPAKLCDIIMQQIHEYAQPSHVKIEGWQWMLEELFDELLDREPDCASNGLSNDLSPDDALAMVCDGRAPAASVAASASASAAPPAEARLYFQEAGGGWSKQERDTPGCRTKAEMEAYLLEQTNAHVGGAQKETLKATAELVWTGRDAQPKDDVAWAFFQDILERVGLAPRPPAGPAASYHEVSFTERRSSAVVL